MKAVRTLGEPSSLPGTMLTTTALAVLTADEAKGSILIVLYEITCLIQTGPFSVFPKLLQLLGELVMKAAAVAVGLLMFESIACKIWASANPPTKSSSTFTMKPEIGSPNDSTDDDSSDFDQVEHVGPPTNGSAKPLTCEVKEYEDRRNLKGEKVLKKVVAKMEVDEKKDGKEIELPSYTSICFYALWKKNFKTEIRSYEANVATSPSSPAIEFKDLWMVFLPGESVITGQDEMNQILSLVSTTFVKTNGNTVWMVTGKCFTHNGKDFGYLHKHVNIEPYQGTKTIKSLPILPLRAYMVGKQWEENIAPRPPLPPGAYYYSYRLESVTVNSRIIVDCKTFGDFKPPNRVWLHERKPLWPKDGEDEIDAISTEDLMICDFQIPGFSLFDKKWCFFAIDFLGDVEFNSDAYKQLLLPKNHKELAHALVKNHGSNEFDDLIKGKGKGLVFVLHGAPGVGKTFTAESIADDVRKPLYIINSGELGVTPHEVETHLNSALKLATHWGAIVLIDEADVFLEQRTIHDLTRNCLVSLFLRTLEYYEGILFLTTNRLTSFDLAFKSRIHLALKYTALDAQRRKELWKLFISRTSSHRLAAWDESVLDDLAKVDINGRQIKNTVRTASTLARSMNTSLEKDHIDIVLATIESFEADLNEDTQDVVELRE
ncbi:hypothetical protein V499_02893 [Pseudogymnoascus sp. VKM F-103]|nr:hypothetical protein V499_02893 [Pseudogymnoascus sp. VKM F-103]